MQATRAAHAAIERCRGAVLPHIYRAMGSRHLPMEGLTLLHVDAHPDLLLPVSLPARTVHDPHTLFSELSIENWVLPAVFAGHVARVVWVRPPWARTMREGRHNFCVGRDPDSGTIRVSSTESYFLSDALYLPEGRLEDAKPVALEVVTLPLNADDAGASTDVPAGRKRRLELEETESAAPLKAAHVEPGVAQGQAASSVNYPESRSRREEASGAHVKAGPSADRTSPGHQTSTDKTSHRQERKPEQPTSTKRLTSPGQQMSRDKPSQKQQATPGRQSEPGQTTSPEQEASHEPATSPAQEISPVELRKSPKPETSTAEKDPSPTEETSPADRHLLPEGAPAGPTRGPVPPGVTAAVNGPRGQESCDVDGAGHRWRGGVRAVALRLLEACPGDGATLILDIDLDFFSVKNPFRDIYSQAELALLHDLYAFSRPDTDTEEALVSAVRRRQQHLEELELTFVELSRDDGPQSLEVLDSDPRWTSLVKLVTSLKSRLKERPDYAMVHQAGLTCDDQELPHHVSSQPELSALLLGLRDALCVLPPPTIVTMARSARLLAPSPCVCVCVLGERQCSGERAAVRTRQLEFDSCSWPTSVMYV
ncbi:UPF0489 protein C5orf22 homolog isoform X2 [Lampetra fluviatilis]